MTRTKALLLGALVLSFHLLSSSLRAAPPQTTDDQGTATTQAPNPNNQSSNSSGNGQTKKSKQKGMHLGLPGSKDGLSPLPTAGATATSGPSSIPTSEQLHPSNAVNPSTATDKDSSLIVAPLPVSNEAIGTGIFGVAAYIFPLNKLDDQSPPSIIGVSTGYVSKGSWGIGGFAQLYIKRDRYRFTIAYAHGDVKLNLYGTGTTAGSAGIAVPTERAGDFYFGKGLIRVSKSVFVGAQYKFVRSNVSIDLSGILPPQYQLPGVGFGQQAAALGLISERDTRNSTFYPSKGSDTTVDVDFFEPNLGSTYRYQNYGISYNKFVGISENQVLAFRTTGCGASGPTIPFTDLCQFGSNNDIRGYEAGRYRDRLMFATQIEFRLHLPLPRKYPRFGVVVFAGVGEVAPNFGSFSFGNLLPGGGAGLRYRLSKKFPVNFRFDGAYGKNGGTYMFGVGEAF